jgi:phosphatidylinositol alpha-1,6-mannosyltransferase
LFHGWLSLILARLVGAKLVSQLHGTEIWEPLTQLQKSSLEASDLILTVSRDTRARTLSQLRIAPEKVLVLNNTFGEQFRPGDRQAARKRYGLGSEPAILTVARLDGRGDYKGHARIIRLIPMLADRGISVIYLIAGTGPGKAQLERIATELGVNDRVRFLGMVPGDNLPDLYRASDLFALPSTGEGFGIAFLEAMACGTPAIGLAVGGATDALADGVLGTCCKPRDFPNCLIEALQGSQLRMIDLPKKVEERFGQHAYQKQLSLVFLNKI